MRKEGYVSIQAVNDMLEYCRNFDGNDAIYIFEKWFREQEPVQPKMGQWIFDEVLDHHYYCSECKSIGVNYWDYCPYCGSYNGGDTNADSN